VFLFRLRLGLATLDEGPQLLVDRLVDAGVFVRGQQLFPAAVGPDVGRLAARRRPRREVVRREQRRHVLELLEVLHRVIGGEPQAARSDLLERVEGELLLAEADPALMHLELLQQLDVERELLQRGRETALQPSGGVQDHIGAAACASTALDEHSPPPPRNGNP
jgi:hypothetical protein